MIEIYTDGSWGDKKIAHEEDTICGGCGIIIRYLGYTYAPNAYNREEYYAFRYTQQDLQELLDESNTYLECIDNISSTLLECLAFINSIKLIQNFLVSHPYENVHIYVDHMYISKFFNIYKECIHNKQKITETQYYGCYMCLFKNFFGDDLALLERIKVSYITAHKGDKYNTIADKLASYSSSPTARIIDTLMSLSLKDIDNEGFTSKRYRKQMMQVAKKLGN